MAITGSYINWVAVLGVVGVVAVIMGGATTIAACLLGANQLAKGQQQMAHGMDTRSHRCPGPNCEARVALNKLACIRHWSQVPASLQRAVFASWDNGRGAGSDRHHAAIAAAVAVMVPL